MKRLYLILLLFALAGCKAESLSENVSDKVNAIVSPEATCMKNLKTWVFEQYYPAFEGFMSAPQNQRLSYGKRIVALHYLVDIKECPKTVSSNFLLASVALSRAMDVREQWESNYKSKVGKAEFLSEMDIYSKAMEVVGDALDNYDYGQLIEMEKIFKKH